MKKRIVFILCMMTMYVTVHAQNYLQLNITEIENGAYLEYCLDQYDSIRIDQDGNCWYNASWEISDQPNGSLVFEGSTDHFTITPEMGDRIQVVYTDCNIHKWCHVKFFSFDMVPEPWTQDEMWFHSGHVSCMLYSYYWRTLNYLWQDGSTDWRYTVTESGTYWVHMYNDCGEFSDTIYMRENMEVYRATVDLETNLNKVTWQTNESQAEYISQVKVYRDGFFVGTAPYENGYFLDAIGSDNAARNYQIVGVTPEGEDCPIASYQKGTIHTTYYLDVNDNLNMTWNIPYVEQGAQGSLTYFQICKYDPITEQLTVVDQVNSLITDYTCGVNQFAGGYPVIAAVFSNSKDRDFEDLSFSNMYTDISIQPQEITITLMPGWTWFSYPYAVPMDIATALGDFVPMEGDVVKYQYGASMYIRGRWTGGVTQFMPGLGYKYYSQRTEAVPLVFDLSSSRALVKP